MPVMLESGRSAHTDRGRVASGRRRARRATATGLDEQLRGIPAALIGRLFCYSFRRMHLHEQLGVIVHSGWSSTDIDRDATRQPPRP
jgi:hypothetical protein